MKIIEYQPKYDEDIKDLLVELQIFIASIDKEGYNIITKEFRENYFKKTMKEVKSFEGKIFLAKEKNKIIGLIIGLINNEEIKTYDFEAPKRGRITELIISKNYRSTGIGNLLINKMEDYFKSVNCKGVLINCFAYNTNAINFYHRNWLF